MQRLALVVLAACSTVAPEPVPTVAPRPPPVAPPAPTVTAKVCIHCTGVSAVDPEGRAHATLYLWIDAKAPLTGVRLASLELTDDNGTVITRGTPAPYVGIVTETLIRDLGPFDGTLGGGARVVLWTGARLDAQDAPLWKNRPTRYRLRIVADGNVAVDVAGAMEPLGSTG